MNVSVMTACSKPYNNQMATIETMIKLTTWFCILFFLYVDMILNRDIFLYDNAPFGPAGRSLMRCNKMCRLLFRNTSRIQTNYISDIESVKSRLDRVDFTRELS